MGGLKLKIGVLTSSRADFGIYTTLLNELVKEDNVELELIVFGTHISRFHGYTLDEIHESFDLKTHIIYGMSSSDEPEAIASAFGTILTNFAQFWGKNSFDWVLCLGDRFEMCAAVQAGIPSQVRFAHLHGGETTTGAIDNVYRHQISLASSLHLTSTLAYSDRVKSLIASDQNVHWVGAMSIQDIENEQFHSWEATETRFGLEGLGEFALVTINPETIFPENNHDFAGIIYNTFEELSKEISLVISLPNADSFGTVYRQIFNDLSIKHADRIVLVENFGRSYYFSVMKRSKFLLGNSSSGIIEAASLNKFAINIGDRQKGRAQNENIINVPFNKFKILEACAKVRGSALYTGENIYFKAGGIQRVIDLLKNA